MALAHDARCRISLILRSCIQGARSSANGQLTVTVDLTIACTVVPGGEKEGGDARLVSGDDLPPGTKV